MSERDEHESLHAKIAELQTSIARRDEEIASRDRFIAERRDAERERSHAAGPDRIRELERTLAEVQNEQDVARTLLAAPPRTISVPTGLMLLLIAAIAYFFWMTR